MAQDGQLRVRQREELRRALATAAEIRGWTYSSKDPMTVAVKEVETLTKVGSSYIAKEIEGELKGKKTEVTELQEVAASIHELADNGDWEDSVEISYAHTAREGDGLATKTEIVTLASGAEAQEAAATIEKRLETWDKLRAEMIEDLKQKRRKLREMEKSIPSFAEASKSVVVDVLAILY
jgi:hypothetical protein